MADILKTLIKASERAAAVARSCCVTGTSKEALLVAEKCEGEANTRFDKDFKTIADVLAQESAKTVIASRFPELAKHIRGEECPEIGGVSVTIQETEESTLDLLSSLVLPNIAFSMARAAHREITLDIYDNLPINVPELNAHDLGVWIDPIDATAEFISGVRGDANADQGLPCVTVLIGAYLRSTGEPVMGVINQPFFDDGKGRIMWGICYGDTKKWGGNDTGMAFNTNTILMSAAENPEITNKIKKAGWEVKSVPGAGHKLLKVSLGEASAYIVSKNTTFRWDTCAPHSILRAMGGDILSYATHTPITYNVHYDADTKQYCNSEGIIAYTDATVFTRLHNILN